ncbi:MAG: choice-of-anchor Q domain-containing protein [Planctomycetaceae bacterium]
MVTITGSTLTFNSANRAGGGIEVVTGTVNIINSNLISNDVDGVVGTPSPGNGGGLHVTGMGATVNITGGTVFNNSAAAEGGGLWNAAGSTMSIDGTLISANYAGGNAADQGGGGIFNAGGTVNVINASIQDNIAGGMSGSGGGILNDADGTLTVTDTLITGNEANRAGGGIEDNSGAGLGITLTNVNLDANVAGPMGSAAPGNGGGLHVTGAGDVMITDGTVSGNTAALEGGGLWNGSGTMTISGTLIAGNTASGSAADDGGGGVFNNGGMLTISDATISNNIADGAAGSGGGILSLDGMVTITGSTLTFNSANRAGGGIEVVTGTVNIVNSNLITNDVDGVAGTPSPGNGGGLHVTGMGATVNITGGTVFNNSAAAEGGGLWNAADSTMTIDGTLISANYAGGNAADQGGGGIFNAGGTVNVMNASIEDNIAGGTSGSGGGILNDAGGLLNISSSNITGNTANRAGGGIETVGGVVNLTSIILDFNDAALGANPGNGGGLHISGAGTVTISLSDITDNTADEGGGLWVSDTGTLTITDSNVLRNDAATRGGGGVHVDGASANGTLTIDGTTFASNTTGLSGGGLNFENGVAIITNSTFSANDAGTDGGGLFFASGSVDIDSITAYINTSTNATGDQVFIGMAVSATSNNSIYSDGDTGTTNNDIEGVFTFGDFNLTSDANNGNFVLFLNTLFTTDPALNALADNGGPVTAGGTSVLTHLPMMGSAVINNGSTVLTVDQRDLARPNGAVDDIGAVEA